MKLISKKELDPVIFGETSVKLLNTNLGANTIAFNEHWHDRLELHLVKSGCLELCCNDEELSICQGEISIVSPSVVHSGRSSNKGYGGYVIMFDVADLYNATVSAKRYIEPIINGSMRFKYKTDNQQIIELANHIVEMQLNAKKHHPLEMISCLYNLLALLCKYCIDVNHSTIQKNGQFDSIINFINANFTTDISVADISKKFGYDESYLCRKFKKVTGLTLSKYIRAHRLERARKLLEKNKEPIRFIALSSGFTDAAYFTNCFRAVYGIAPTKYRAIYFKEKNK